MLSIATAIVPGLIGFMVAYAIFTAKRGTLLRQVSITASGVFANFGGVPLAFLFIATLGSTGIVTGWLKRPRLQPLRRTASTCSRSAAWSWSTCTSRSR